MKCISNNSRLCNKLDKYFKNNIELTVVTRSEFIVLTKDDKVYKIYISPEISTYISLCDDDSRIESLIVDELCYKGIIDFAYGLEHVVARNKDGQIFIWGENGDGQTGLKERDDKDYEKFVEKPQLNEYLNDKYISFVSCGVFHTLVLTRSGEVYAWGQNHKGQIGIGNNQNQFVPIKLDCFNKEKVISISCGSYHSMALTESGRVFCWGCNTWGQLGVGNTIDSNAPKLIKLNDVLIAKISSGQRHSLMLSHDGDVYAFGGNNYGEIGIKSKCTLSNIQKIPTKLEISNKFDDIGAHFRKNVSMARSLDGICYIWGLLDAGPTPIPMPTPFKAFDEVFANNFDITYRPFKGIFYINDPFILNGKHRRLYEEMGELGRGSFGTVFKVSTDYYAKNNDILAIKKIPFVIEDINEYLKEFQISATIRNFDCEYIIKYIDAWFENDFDFGTNQYINSLSYYILMELCDKSLEDIIYEINGDFNLCKNETLTHIGYYFASELFSEILEGIGYLHKQNPPIIHRDIKPANILLKKGIDNKFVKIADFDLLAFHKFAEQRILWIGERLNTQLQK